MSDVKKASRRDFLAGSMGTFAAASVAGGLSIARSAHASANDDTLKACLIGCGGRGTGAAINFLNVPGRVKLVALADVFEDRVQNCYKQLSDGKKNKHVDMVKAIRNDEKYREGWHGAPSTFTAVLGRMATYSGKTVAWDEAVQKGPSRAPELKSWDEEPPLKPDADGRYKSSVAMPGIYDPFA